MGLSSHQKLQVLDLYFRGVEKYTDICRELNLPYNSVNSFMTKWKTQKGIINKRKPRKAKDEDLLVIPPMKVLMTVAEQQELKFLRHFYQQFIKAKKAS